MLDFDLQKYVFAVYANRVGADVFGEWRTHGLATLNAEAALMQRAFNLTVLKKPIAKQRLAMRADIVGGEDLTVGFVERDGGGVGCGDFKVRCEGAEGLGFLFETGEELAALAVASVAGIDGEGEEFSFVEDDAAEGETGEREFGA